MPGTQRGVVDFQHSDIELPDEVIIWHWQYILGKIQAFHSNMPTYRKSWQNEAGILRPLVDFHPLYRSPISATDYCNAIASWLWEG
jgi:hypothetical protein